MSIARFASASSSRLAFCAARPSLTPLLRPTRFLSTESPSKRDPGEEGIHAKLAAKFPGKRLEVQDVSGELRYPELDTVADSLVGGCGSFYAIEISSPAFNGLSTIKQHKLVNECLKEDIKGIHGLQVSCSGHTLRRWLS